MECWKGCGVLSCVSPPFSTVLSLSGSETTPFYWKRAATAWCDTDRCFITTFTRPLPLQVVSLWSTDTQTGIVVNNIPFPATAWVKQHDTASLLHQEIYTTNPSYEVWISTAGFYKKAFQQNTSKNKCCFFVYTLIDDIREATVIWLLR